jgi:hypothetical protein
MRRVRTRREVLTALMEHGTKKAAAFHLGYNDRSAMDRRLRVECVRITSTRGGIPVLIVRQK